MNIIVCIKQVPATTDIKIDPKTNTLIREGIEGIINPYDTHALEEGLRLREKLGGTLTVISMGPLQAAEGLREAIALGADRAFLLSDKVFAGADSLATSYTLTCAIAKIKEFNLIICGKQTMDSDTGHVGPGISEMLNLPFIAYVSKIMEVSPDYLKAQRLVDGGYEIVEMELPGVISVVKEINNVRLPSLRGMMKAKKLNIDVWTAKDINADLNKVGLSGSATYVERVFNPPSIKKGEMITGSPEEQALILVEKLRSQRLL